jgi:hypothetical protein
MSSMAALVFLAVMASSPPPADTITADRMRVDDRPMLNGRVTGKGSGN